jgi:translation initiation factor IF-2
LAAIKAAEKARLAKIKAAANARAAAIDAEDAMSPIKRSIAKRKREAEEAVAAEIVAKKVAVKEAAAAVAAATAAAAAPKVTAPKPAEPVAAKVETPTDAPAAAPTGAAAATDETTPADATAAAPADGKAEEKPGAAKEPEKPGRRGNVVGFIDPASFQQSTPARRRPDSRRIQGRDDATPDVRPTFGRDRGRAQSPTGPRGKMTAAELREREQGRFLRRNRAAGGPPGRGGRGGRGGSRDTVTLSPYSGQKVSIEEPITITKLSDALSLKSSVVQKRALEHQYGMFTVNQTLDHDTATLLCSEFDVELDIKQEVTAEQQLIEEVAKKRSEIEEERLSQRAPTVAFLGHVDHGKTTLIDKIRESKVADKESGGITQHIGAYQVQTAKGHSVTIVDTPGHEAFTAMRARGAKAVDIVVLVVAGDDGVKPSTVEAINHAKFAKTPIVVAINKKDREGFNANTVIQQLMGQELVPEQYGGKTAMFETSGMTGEGIEELLEHIFLMGEMELELKAHPEGPASGVVLEAEIQQGRGIIAHLLVQDGTLQRGDVILAGEGYGKVRQLLDDRGKTLTVAGPSTPVSVTGLDALPGVGQPFHVIDTLAQAKEIAGERERANRAVMLASKREPSRELEAILGSAPKQDRETINVIIRTDVQGSAEVLRQEIEALEHDEVQVKLIHSGVGPITESDVDLAATSSAIMIAFQVSVNAKARQEAERKGLIVRRYSVIYEVLDDLRRVMEGALKPEYLEEITGHVEIRRLFKSSKIGLIAGCIVLDGTIKRNNKCRLLRDSIVVYTGSIGSLRREKDEANEVRSGFECGIVLRDFRDIREGDVVETFRMKEVKRTL